MELPQCIGAYIMNNKRRNKLPITVADLLVEDIFELSDEELIKEAQEEYDDIASEISKTRNVINSAVMKSRKSRLTTAKEQLERKRNATNQSNILTLNINDKRALINQAKESVESLTLAARNEEEMSESDINGVLQDLIDLGVIDGNGNIK